jgi:hypothetical protein
MMDIACAGHLRLRLRLSFDALLFPIGWIAVFLHMHPRRDLFFFSSCALRST